MKVYIVFDAQDDGYTYASEDVIAVFSTEQKARDYIIQCQATEREVKDMGGVPVHLMYREYIVDEEA